MPISKSATRRARRESDACQHVRDYRKFQDKPREELWEEECRSHWGDTGIDVRGMTHQQVACEAKRWAEILDDRSLATDEDNNRMRIVAENTDDFLVDGCYDYFGAARLIWQDWDMAASDLFVD